MKKSIYIGLVLLFAISKGFGQSPDWKVNENEYQYTMTFVAFLTVDGNRLDDEQEKVAAFVNGVCRGVTNLTYVENEDAHYAYLTVFSNNAGETISFQLYDADKDNIVSIDKTQHFEINGHYGDLFHAYSMAQPALSSEAELLDLTFEGAVINNKTVVGTDIMVYVDQAVDRSKMNIVFDLSLGAGLYLNGSRQTSGANTIDFRTPQQFLVLSEDRSVAKQWSVRVQPISAAFAFFKKDAVCYRGGAIKVTSMEDQKLVTLGMGGTIFSESVLANGEVIFANLEPGTYQVLVDGIKKDITINIKD